MSPRGNYIEAINNIYDVLRWAETKNDAKTVQKKLLGLSFSAANINPGAQVGIGMHFNRLLPL